MTAAQPAKPPHMNDSSKLSGAGAGRDTGGTPAPARAAGTVEAGGASGAETVEGAIFTVESREGKGRKDKRDLRWIRLALPTEVE